MINALQALIFRIPVSYKNVVVFRFRKISNNTYACFKNCSGFCGEMKYLKVGLKTSLCDSSYVGRSWTSE
jgi:hypothetical protein